MRLCRAQVENDVFWAVLKEEIVYPIMGTPYEKIEQDGRQLSLSSVTLKAPCNPTKVVAVGLNYRDHAMELDHEILEEPVIFLKPVSAVVGPFEPIIIPAMSQRVDYEAEVGIVMKKRCKNVLPSEALQYVLGCTCVNDVTARDLQKIDGQWTRAKSFDTFAPIGPWVETEVDYANLAVEARLNGRVCQQSNTRFMMHNIPALISFISQVMTLEPGDVIATGTPAGIGPMAIGDTIEIEVSGVGILQNTVQ